MVYVVDDRNNDIQVLNSDLTFFDSFEGQGSNKLSSPCSVACDSTGRVYVADWDNSRVQVFTHEGQTTVDGKQKKVSLDSTRVTSLREPFSSLTGGKWNCVH